jgi:hypothetical protein
MNSPHFRATLRIRVAVSIALLPAILLAGCGRQPPAATRTAAEIKAQRTEVEAKIDQVNRDPKLSPAEKTRAVAALEASKP